jgi:Xaa-Pro aminopeptidase
MMSGHHSNRLPLHAERYETVLTATGADAFVLTSEPALQHAIGIRLYTQRLIPQRPVACVIASTAPPVCVCVEYELEQLRLEAPDLEVRAFGEIDGDPWRLVAEALEEVDAKRVIVEDTMLAPWVNRLQEQFDGAVEPSYEHTVAPRTTKDPDEIEIVQEASRGAETALAAGAGLLEPGRTESEIARAIVFSFLDQFGSRASEVTGVCTAPQNNRAMHHIASEAIMPTNGPVRLGIVGRLDGYWVLLTRMLVLGKDDRFAAAYESYVASYEENLASLAPGERCSDLYMAAQKRVQEAGHELFSQKIGHGTGLDFRELPWISAQSDSTLEPGTVLAYDYGADFEGYTLHVEDRVLIGTGPPVRLSDGWDLRDVRGGFRSLL